MNLPTHEDIADRRVAQFKQTLSETLEAQDLGFFEQVVESYQQEHNVALSDIAAALAYLLQKERPLLPERFAPEPVAPAMSRERGERTERGERPPRRAEREPRGAESRPPKRVRDVAPGMERFRIEVGRAHNLEPKHVVGAIANEAGLDSQYIDNISIQDDYSTVDLPEGIPKDVLRHLQHTRICGLPMRIHRLGEDAPPDSRGAGPRRPRGDKQTHSERPARGGKTFHGDKPARAGKPNRGDQPLRIGKASKPAHGKPVHGKSDKARKPRKP